MEYHNGQRAFPDAVGEMWYDIRKMIDRQVHKADMLLSIYRFLSDWVSICFKTSVRKT